MSRLAPSPEDVAALLRERGVTPTQQRVMIASVLLARPQHLHADQVLALVNRDGARASKATVYNTLGLLAERGLIREVKVDPARVVYDSNTAPHFHFYDVTTGVLTDIDEADLSIGELPEPPEGATLDGLEVIIRVRSGT